jgi:hypothetical protein
MASPDETGGNKMVIAVAAMAAGLVAQKGFELTWRLVRGSDPRSDDEDSPLLEVIVFAAASAAAAAVARNLVTHQAKRRPRDRAALTTD